MIPAVLFLVQRSTYLSLTINSNISQGKIRGKPVVQILFNSLNSKACRSKVNLQDEFGKLEKRIPITE